MNLLKYPLEGVMSLLRVVGGSNRAPVDASLHDPLHAEDVRVNGHRHLQAASPKSLLPRITLHDVVRSCYALAKGSLRDQTGERLPAKHNFFYMTWISSYCCEFEATHVVRWVDRSHPIAAFFRFPRSNDPTQASYNHQPIAFLHAEPRRFGHVMLFAEKAAQRCVDHLLALCGDLHLEVATVDSGVHAAPPPQQQRQQQPAGMSESGDGPPVARVIDSNDVATSVPPPSSSSLLMEQQDPEDVILNQVRTMPTHWDTYVQQVYGEICAGRIDPLLGPPRYYDCFVNMGITRVSHGPQATIIYRWLDARHPFTLHPDLRTVIPVDEFNTPYGQCRVYEDFAISRVVDALVKEFARREMEFTRMSVATAPEAVTPGNGARQPPLFGGEQV